MTIEPLDAKHDALRVAFSCGIEPLDRYLKEQAGQDARKRVAVPYVLISTDNCIAGYYTLSSTNIRIDALPAELVKKLRLPRYPVFGATLIGRLARDLSFRGQGVGDLLLADAVKVALAMSEKIASFAVVVDAKDDSAARSYADFGFTPLPETPHRLSLPMLTVKSLFSNS